MPYLNCPTCRLTVAMSGPQGAMQHCPRCMSRAKKLVDLFVSAHPRGREPLPWSDRPWLTASEGARPAAS